MFDCKKCGTFTLDPESHRCVAFEVPTFYGNSPDTQALGVEDFEGPFHQVHVVEQDGLRVILGNSKESPDLMIERRPGGWAVYVHAQGDGTDCNGWVCITDKGQAYLIPDGLEHERVQIVEHEPEELNQ